ncbi:MAG: hypothetical protein LBV08_02815 [Clostridiales bacterium]|jgi:uncharacterized membrane protein YkvI|nr:hypothetical protein [Clostridiales bacterium]
MGKNIFKIAGVYVAMIVGAGFASGQELMQFFLKYGLWGFLGLAISSFLIFLVGYAVLDISITNNFNSQSDFLRGLTGDKASLIIETLIGFMFFVFYATMVSAAGAAFSQAFNFDFTLVVIVFSVLCFVSLFFGIEAVVKINSSLAPFMVIGGVLTGLYIIIFEAKGVFSPGLLTAAKYNWLTSSIAYAAYNIVTAISVLVSVKNIAGNRKTAKRATMLSGACLYLFGSTFLLGLYLNRAFAVNFEVPILAILHKHGDIFEYVYLIILLMAIFTTAVGNGFAFIDFLSSHTKLNKLAKEIILIVLGIVFAHIGFSTLVAKAYPVFAFVGFFEIAIILYRFFKNRAKKY